MQQPTTEKYTKISELRPYMKGLNCVFIVLEKGNVTKTKDEHLLAHALVADNTAAVHLSLWDTAADWLQPGDIIRLRGGYSTIFKNNLILYAGRYGNVTRIGEFSMVFVETPNMSNLQWSVDPNNPSNMIPSSAPSSATSTPFNATSP